MKLNEVVPWGRTLDEYRRMFSLTDTDLTKSILGVGDGPASFNAEMTAAGYSVVSVDPIYQFSTHELDERISATYTTVMEQMAVNADRYNWTNFRDTNDLGRERMQAMDKFLADYEVGLLQGRYQFESLPNLPFADQSFELVLVSHLLFLYSEQLDQNFHMASIRELVRLTPEVRIFPLLTLKGHVSPYIEKVLEQCQAWGVTAQTVDVDYHFQKGANQMLRLVRSHS